MNDRSSKARGNVGARLAAALAVAGALAGCGTPTGGGGGAPTGGTVTLDVEALAPGMTIPEGRLAVVWFQLDDDGPDPVPTVAYDAPFAPGATRVEIPLASLAPPAEANLLCARACDDEARCPCTGEPRLGIGYVVVVTDANHNGHADVTSSQSTTEPIYGVGRFVMGYSATAQTTLPAPYGQIFTAGVEAGVAPYAIAPRDGGTFDRIGAAIHGGALQLAVCPGAVAGCRLPLPNLT